MGNDGIRRFRTETLLWGVLMVAVAMLLARCFFGAIWSDEAYQLSTALRYHLGDRPLVDSWDTNFSSALLAVPFVRLYLGLFGSTDGILLAYRGVFFMLSIATAGAAWWALKGVLGGRWAIAMAILLVLYIPYLSPVVGYGADWLWHMGAAFVALRFHSFPPRHGILNVLPGVLSAVGVIGNPPTATVIPVFMMALWITNRRHGQSRYSALALYLFGLTVALAAFALALRALSGPHLLAHLDWLSRPEDHDWGLAAHMDRLWSVRWLLAIPIGVGTVVGVAARLNRDRLGAVAFEAALLLGLLGWLFATATDRIWTLIAPQSLVFITASAVLLSEFVSGRLRLRPEQILLVLPALGAGIGWLLGSNGGVASGVLAAPLLMAAALMSLPVIPAASSPDVARSPRVPLLFAALTLMLASTILQTPEGPVSEMTTRAEEGPFKGIYVTPGEAARNDNMVRTIRGLPSNSGRIAFFERFPKGYLVAHSLPGTHSTWATSATSPRLQEYVNRTGNRPERLVLTRFPADLDDGQFPDSIALDDYPDAYTLVYWGQHVRVFDRVVD